MAVDGAVLETVGIENDPIALSRELAKRRSGTRGGDGGHPGPVLGRERDRRVRHPPAPGPSAGDQGFPHQRVRKDESDARLHADLLRIGRLSEAWIAPPEIRELRVGALDSPGLAT